VKLGFSTFRRNTSIWFRAFADMAMERIYGENNRIEEEVL
jgi:hypothetical protein